MPQNLRSPRARWRKGSPMQRHDRLPPALRRWLIHAALPWSAASVLHLWQRTLREGGSESLALQRLDAAERATLRREAPRVWGAAYPVCENSP
ncbi:DUF6525 family protein [Gemmobacter denitrificans]|uniref:DUF6525 family protein n=1 Tax=Gemmobacter denitrificans TaxID=3123040 RepID=A0ABU8BTL6_9RHOB